MRALVTLAPGRAELQDVPDPTAAAGEAVIAVEAVGLCGSDANVHRGTHPYGGYPLIQGHEVVGRVVDAPGGTLPTGTRVAVDPVLACGVCPTCAAGLPNACPDVAVLGVHRPGGLAELLAAPVTTLHPVGEDLDPVTAVLTEPVAVALHALARSGATAGDALVVLGGGSIGRAVTVAAAARRIRTLVVDRDEQRLELVHRMGASAVVHSERDDVSAAIERFEPGGPRLLIEATGATDVVERACELAAPGARVVVVGVSPAPVRVPMVSWTRKELTVTGARNSHGEFPEAVAVVRERRALLRSSIGPVVPLPEAARALAGLVPGRRGGKTVVRVG